jgi:hypothetical protein
MTPVLMDISTSAPCTHALRAINPYDWLIRRDGALPPVLGRLAGQPPESLALVAAGLSGHGTSRGLMSHLLDRLPLTGATGNRPLRVEWGIEWGIVCLAASLGCDILGYSGEKEGEYIHQVISVAGREDSRSNEGANLFEAHMEAPHLPEPPDLVMITYLRNAEHGPTTIWPMEGLLATLSPRELEVAFEPRFAVEMGESWGERRWVNFPVLDRDSAGQLRLRLDLTSMKGGDPDAQSILDKLFRHCVNSNGVLQNCIEFVMAPGDVLLFDNRRNCHGRVPIPNIGLPPGERRWLQRVYLRRRDR